MSHHNVHIFARHKPDDGLNLRSNAFPKVSQPCLQHYSMLTWPPTSSLSPDVGFCFTRHATFSTAEILHKLLVLYPPCVRLGQRVLHHGPRTLLLDPSEVPNTKVMMSVTTIEAVNEYFQPLLSRPLLICFGSLMKQKGVLSSVHRLPGDLVQERCEPCTSPGDREASFDF